MIIVPTATPGFILVRNVSVMGHAGSGHGSHSEVSYQSCWVPRSNLLGEEGGGFVIAQDRLGPGRIHHCMRWLGIAAQAFEMMCQAPSASPTTPSSPTGNERAARIYDGADEVHKTSLGHRVLRRYAEG